MLKLRLCLCRDSTEDIANYLEDCEDWGQQQAQSTATVPATGKPQTSQHTAAAKEASNPSSAQTPVHQATAKSICKAVEQGDIAELRNLLTALQTLPDCDCGDVKAAEKIATMLALPAAQRGHAAIVYLLHEFGGTFEEVDEDRGGPPLMHAANNGHAAAVTALLKVSVPVLSAQHGHTGSIDTLRVWKWAALDAASCHTNSAA